GLGRVGGQAPGRRGREEQRGEQERAEHPPTMGRGGLSFMRESPHAKVLSHLGGRPPAGGPLLLLSRWGVSDPFSIYYSVPSPYSEYAQSVVAWVLVRGLKSITGRGEATVGTTTSDNRFGAGARGATIAFGSGGEVFHSNRYQYEELLP